MMDDPFESNSNICEIKKALQNNDFATAAAKIQEYLDEQDNIALNIAITGESGSGKSTFVNAIRGVDNKDKEAAPTGCVETTKAVTPYPHPNYPNVTVWDLPGVGTTNFPVKKYLEHVGFEKYDFFIIISQTRFSENDANLAKKIKQMEKNFYFVRSKIDADLYSEKESKREFNEKQTLDSIKKNCTEGLQKLGVAAPQVFLVSNFKLHQFDFHLLQNTLQRELPAHKKTTLLFAMPNVSQEIINKKKEAFHNNIKYYAMISAVGAAITVPGLSVSVNLALLIQVVRKYLVGFGLDKPTLQRLAARTGVPMSKLTDGLRSPLVAKTINNGLMLKVLSQLPTITALMIAEEGSKAIPIFGIGISMTLSSFMTYKALSFFLDMLAKDAQTVFTRALGLNTPV
ncbi:interferon-inducible GTPase 5-like isoform X2 [Betta splendens]|uniref:Interferon-inducible GTPase 5-like isoform X2 n=1 Tax=Betta splendens TaxID=158456 RepID=A0A9W2Y3K9_BETSP|nr:interferon-inducible GTPase 5-like isoform X2 [Betta splendens]